MLAVGPAQYCTLHILISLFHTFSRLLYATGPDLARWRGNLPSSYHIAPPFLTSTFPCPLCRHFPTPTVLPIYPDILTFPLRFRPSPFFICEQVKMVKCRGAIQLPVYTRERVNGLGKRKIVYRRERERREMRGNKRRFEEPNLQQRFPS